jgi:hypothetical protein
VGFEVLIAVVTKSSISWDITPCSPLKGNRRFGGTCRLHPQGRGGSTYSLILNVEATFSSEKSLTFNGIRGLISQKMEVFETEG